MKDQQSIIVKEKRELEKWEKKKAKPRISGYIWVLAVVVTLIHIVDETITNVNGSIQSNVVDEFFVREMGLSYNEGLSQLSFLSIFSLIVSLVGPIYKTLADRIGRKPLLVMNVLGFSLGMALCFLSNNFMVYIVGMCCTTFFASHDMQVTYILESAPDDKRASFYGVTKGIGTIGCVMLPLLRMIFMGDDGTKWRLIFIVPGILGLVIAAFIVIFARETDPFLEKRIRFLKDDISRRESGEVAEGKKKAENKVGIIEGTRYILKNRQLKILLIVGILMSLPTMALSSYYQSIMYLSGMSDSQITTALFAYPFVFAVFNIVTGRIADKVGRKPIVVAAGIGFCVFYVLFAASCMMKWAPFLVGLMYALYISCFWVVGDFRNMIVNEPAPTRIRFSVTGAIGVISFVVIIAGMIISSICVGIFKNVAVFCGVFSIPCIIIGTLIFLLKVKETNGVDLNSIE